MTLCASRARTLVRNAAWFSAFVLAGCGGSGSSFALNAIYGSIESASISPRAHAALVKGLRRKIKHVFIIFQENHSFDNYFSTYPGSENLGTAFAIFVDVRQASRARPLRVDLPAMASLPDESVVAPYGPRDATAGLSDLARAFDARKLRGSVAPNPPSMADISDAEVGNFPPRMTCASLHIKRGPMPEAPDD